MNFLKKKLKPLASSFTAAANTHTNSSGSKTGKNLEDDLYDEYVVEAPPHPSELIALGVDPAQIDVNDPDKLRELYRKAKEEGKDKQTNSVLLAKQRQREELEEKKRTREEWKFFDNLTLRVEQVVKDSQKTLEQLKDRSAVNKLAEPEYELRQTADEVFRPTSAAKQEKVGEEDWVNFDDDDEDGDKAASKSKKDNSKKAEGVENATEELDEFGCPRRKSSLAIGSKLVAQELLEDFGIDLRTDKQRRAEAENKKRAAERDLPVAPPQPSASQAVGSGAEPKRLDIDIKAAARPRPRPGASSQQQQQQQPPPPPTSNQEQQQQQQQVTQSRATSQPATTAADEIDPFDTSFLATEDRVEPEKVAEQQKVLDPFDTSYVNF